jgi:26S proteasome regulatory subunit N1
MEKIKLVNLMIYKFLFIFQRLCADIVSVLGMTTSDNRDSLTFKLLGSKEELGSWGHEYVR